MYAFNLAIHIYQSRQEYSQSSSSSQKVAEYEETAREEFHRLAKKIMNEFAEFFERLQQPTIGILSLVLVVFGYFIKARSEGTDNKSEQFVRAIIPFISRFLNLETPFFALIVTIFEESLEFLPHQEGYDVYKTQSCIRIMLDKLSSSKCSDQEFLSVLKFCFNFSKNKQSARLLFNERILNQLSASSQLKVKSEYVNRYRDSQHLL